MTDENMKKELKRIKAELRDMIRIAQEDFLREEKRYNTGIIVGIGYAWKEIDKLERKLKQSPPPV